MALDVNVTVTSATVTVLEDDTDCEFLSKGFFHLLVCIIMGA